MWPGSSTVQDIRKSRVPGRQQPLLPWMRSQNIASRVAALDLLAGAPYDQVLSVAEALLDVSQPLELQLAAVAAALLL